MPLPPSLTTITLTRSYVRPDGTMPSGYVTFELVQPGLVDPDYVVLDSFKKSLVSGVLTAVVPSNEDPDLHPSGIVYRITECVSGITSAPWYASIPVSPSTQTLNSLAHLDPPGLFAVRVVSVNNVLPNSAGNVDLGPLSAPVTSVAGKTGAVTLVKADVGLGNVDNTTDTNKPVSTATQTALNAKADTTALNAKATKSVIRDAYITTGDINPLPNTGASWGILSGFELSIPAQSGDSLVFSANAMRRDSTGNSWLDFGIVVGSTIVKAFSSNTTTPATEGDNSWYVPTSGIIGHSGIRRVAVTGGLLDSGNIRIVVLVKSNGSGILYASTDYPFYWMVENKGAVG